MPTRRTRHPLPPVAAALLLAAVSANASRAAPPTLPLDVPTFRGTERFIVSRPGEKSSGAKLESEGPAAKNHRLTSTVIVRTSDAGALAKPLGDRGLVAAPADKGSGELAGFFTVDCASVAEAAALAAMLKSDPRVTEAYLDIARPLNLRSTVPSDPGLSQQWHLVNTEQPEADINPVPAWKAGFTGSGVTIGIVELGFNTAHPDLAPNFNAAASQSGGSTDHGTSVAGLAAAAANGLGGVGVAYNALVSRQYIGSSMQNADALLFLNSLNHVKCNSWGPFDGPTISQIPSVERQAIASAAATGRGGLGTVLVWAGGNGGQFNDRVDYDPYASSRYTIAVGAVDEADQRSLYSEPGASLLVVAPSDRDINNPSDLGIYSSTGTTEYTNQFGGTSASAPIASGVVAMLLDANPALTWRDVQHVLVSTARKCHPTSPSWSLNGAPGGGRWVSHDYGFGAIDAGAAALAASTWTSVAPETSLTSGPIIADLPIPDLSPSGVTSSFTVQRDLVVESVEIELSVAHMRIGHLRVKLTSPSGLESIFAVPRSDFTQNYNGYLFTSVRHWGERSPGLWRLTVADESPTITGTLTGWVLNLHGTAPPCPCDFNGVGGVTVQDIYDFFTAWFSGAGDFNASGATTVQDIYDFLDCFVAPPGGC